MPMPTIIRSPPSLDDYTPLAEHQQQTPATFYGGKPVLHYHATGAKAWLPKSQLGSLVFFPAGLDSQPTGPEGAQLNGALEENVEQKVDLFVNSETFTIFSPATESGLTIPYPSITLHAIKKIGHGEQEYPVVYLQLEFTDGGDDDETFDTIELTIIPPASPTASPTEAAAEQAGPSLGAAKLFDAISDCSNLHPDPNDDDDEDEDNADRIVFEGDVVEGFSAVYGGRSDGGLPPPMPGSSGWITAENAHEYFDDAGNWIGGDADMEEAGEELGEGAGSIHPRDETDKVNGRRDEQGDSKRLKGDGER